MKPQTLFATVAMIALVALAGPATAGRDRGGHHDGAGDGASQGKGGHHDKGDDQTPDPEPEPEPEPSPEPSPEPAPDRGDRGGDWPHGQEGQAKLGDYLNTSLCALLGLDCAF
jgi:hypothetical protein